MSSLRNLLRAQATEPTAAVDREANNRRSRRPRRIASVLVALAALAAGVGAPIASDVATAPFAGAYCPPGSPGGSLAAWWGQEANVSGTCDWDNTYHGWLQDSVTDGSCVYALFIDDGNWDVQAYACTTGAWIDYWKWDYNGDYYSQTTICRDYDCFPVWVESHGY